MESTDSDTTNVSVTDAELALLGPPFAKEGSLYRKQYWEATNRRAKSKNWMEVFVVIQKGELDMFVFGGSNNGGAGVVGGGNWLSNATHVGTLSLAHSLAHSLPPPGYSRQRPHCFVLTLASGGVYFFQAGTEDLVNEWVATCNYWAARQSKEPLAGGVSNMEYGWNRVLPGNQDDDRVDAASTRSARSIFSKRSIAGSMIDRSSGSPLSDRVYINDWKPPMPPSIASALDEEAQLEAMEKQVVVLNQDLEAHQALQGPMMELVSFFFFFAHFQANF
jgi:PH and SEC7 domain-containing protein